MVRDITWGVYEDMIGACLRKKYGPRNVRRQVLIVGKSGAKWKPNYRIKINKEKIYVEASVSKVDPSYVKNKYENLVEDAGISPKQIVIVSSQGFTKRGIQEVGKYGMIGVKISFEEAVNYFLGKTDKFNV